MNKLKTVITLFILFFLTELVHAQNVVSDELKKEQRKL